VGCGCVSLTAFRRQNRLLVAFLPRFFWDNVGRREGDHEQRKIRGGRAGAELLPCQAFAANRKFVFKIKTKSGGIVGNVTIEAKDAEAAKHKPLQCCPDCEILDEGEVERESKVPRGFLYDRAKRR